MKTYQIFWLAVLSVSILSKFSIAIQIPTLKGHHHSHHHSEKTDSKHHHHTDDHSSERSSTDDGFGLGEGATVEELYEACIRSPKHEGVTLAQFKENGCHRAGKLYHRRRGHHRSPGPREGVLHLDQLQSPAPKPCQTWENDWKNNHFNADCSRVILEPSDASECTITKVDPVFHGGSVTCDPKTGLFNVVAAKVNKCHCCDGDPVVGKPSSEDGKQPRVGCTTDEWENDVQNCERCDEDEGFTLVSVINGYRQCLEDHRDATKNSFSRRWGTPMS